MKGNFLKVLATGTLVASMLVGCSSGGGETQAAKTLAEGDTVKIGLNYELSGETATYGNAMDKGSKLAIKEYNAKDDAKYNIEAVSLDNKGDAAESTSIATKLMTEDQVVMQIGPATSGDSIATYPVADKNSVPVISPAVTQNGGMLKDDGEAHEYAWRICFEDSAQASAMAVFAKEQGKTKAVIYSDSTSDYAKGLAADFKSKFEDLGGEVVAEESFASKDTDFNAALSKIKSQDFDVLYVPGYYNESGLIIKQARDAGIDQTILGPDGMDSPKLAELAGAENLNNVYFTTAYTTVDASEELTAFIETYTEEYGEAPDMFSVLAYDATNLGLQALEEAGETGAKLNEAIKNMEFTGLTGSFTFDDAHTPIKDVLVVELENGAQVNPVKVDPNAE